jgi:hypothetical protein
MIDIGIAAPLPFSGKKSTKKIKEEKGSSCTSRRATRRAHDSRSQRLKESLRRTPSKKKNPQRTIRHRFSGCNEIDENEGRSNGRQIVRTINFFDRRTL